MKVVLKKHIPAKGYPLTDKDYEECHKYATRMEIKKFGIHHFHKLGILIPQHPHELLGRNLPSGEIDVSRIVPPHPKWEREEVIYHEKKEAECIARKKRKRLLKKQR